MTQEHERARFVWLFVAVLALIVTYPYFGDTRTGAFLGGLTSLAVVLAGVYAVHTRRKTLFASCVLGAITIALSVWALLSGVRGSAWVEAGFTAFYAFTTVALFAEIMGRGRFTRDTIFGVVCIYLLIGLTFGSLYDLVETLKPGSFSVNVDMVLDGYIGFRQLLFFSFMTLAAIGYGDISPVTTQAQSLAIIEGVVGVFFVAVLIARIVNAYESGRR
jgi:hypothetical protein